MSRRLGNTLRAGVLFLLLTGGLGAFQLLSAQPAFAAAVIDGGSNTDGCYTADASQVPARTRVNCLPPDRSSTGACLTTENGVNTCNVRKLGNGLEFFALATAVAGIFVSCILWALGSKGQNPGQELTGKRGILVCLAAAMAIGVFPTLTTFFDNIAGDVDNTGVTKASPPTIVLPGQTTTTTTAPTTHETTRQPASPTGKPVAQ